ncbi:bifunctional diguanylate cyclase/phosphohydrolase [Alicyclobacillus mengziensis]|uniref:Diguanylate cyclase n=1 Tax=Alicyclobacillus mengziensis TaxID=2931921 RepID=A0A9X7W0L3_9BACL|nr:HD domain-containing phosphohydrolase [Alicyclobacillus mengziensis]QSO48134.1 diguanylate cyclase [Alicyclobacillus mengziensis]
MTDANKVETRRIVAATLSILIWLAIAGWNVLTQHAFSIPGWVVFYTLAGLLILVERFRIYVASSVSMSLEDIYLIGFAMVYPIGIVVWAGLLLAVISAVRFRRGWFIQIMNALGLIMAVVCAKQLYELLVPVPEHWNVSLIGPFAVFGITFVLVTLAAFAVILVLIDGKDAIAHFKESMSLQVLAVYGIEVLIGLVLAIVLQDAGLSGALLFTALVLLVAWSYRDYFKMAKHFRELAIKDELTGLHNHRYIHSKMDEFIEQKTPFAVLMMDIDHFRHYNEVWGHVRGDDALRTVADLMRQNRLQEERQARFSGEEFMILLPDIDLPQAQLRAEMLRKAIEDTTFPGAERLPGKKMTVSIGVARYPDMADNKQALLTMVDDALYKGKLTGRNKVSLYTSVLDEMKHGLPLGDEGQELIKTIKVFLAILNSKDRYTYAHTERDVVYATGLAERIGLSEERMQFLRFGAFLHDIGKVEVPIEVLTKRGPLTRDEWQVMKSHVEIGENIAKPIPGLGPCLPVIRHHHERFDGTGYPDGLKGEDIPLEARILTVADSFDAMTTSRPYQRKRSLHEAIAELRRCAGTQFDPNLVEPFIEVIEEIGLLTEESAEDLA